MTEVINACDTDITSVREPGVSEGVETDWIPTSSPEVNKTNTKSESEPSDSGYLEPPDPWKDAPPWTTKDLLAAYRKGCELNGAKPFNKVLSQLQGIENVGERYEIISFKGEKLDMKHSESLEEILRRVQFRCIDLEASHLDDETAGAIFDMIEYYNSTCKLNIAYNKNLTMRGWQGCARLLRRAPSLTFLDARNCDLNERYVPIIGRALKLGCFLTTLHLENTYISGRPLVILVAALKFNVTLKELFLADNKLMSTDGVQIGSLLKENNKLQLLDLRNNHLQDVGCAHICDGLCEQDSGSGLVTLVLWNNQLTYHGMVAIGKCLSFTESLETLNLGHNNITNEGMHLLKSGLLKSKSLLRMGLQGTKVTCEGAVALAEVIADNSRILRLDLRENEIKTAGLMALSLSLKVNESVIRLDLDKDPKKESSMKDYADQQKRLHLDINSHLERNRNIIRKIDEERKRIEEAKLLEQDSESLQTQMLPCDQSPLSLDNHLSVVSSDIVTPTTLCHTLVTETVDNYIQQIVSDNTLNAELANGNGQMVKNDDENLLNSNGSQTDNEVDTLESEKSVIRTDDGLCNESQNSNESASESISVGNLVDTNVDVGSAMINGSEGPNRDNMNDDSMSENAPNGADSGTSSASAVDSADILIDLETFEQRRPVPHDTGKPDFYTNLTMNGLTQELATVLDSIDKDYCDNGYANKRDGMLIPDEFEQELDAMLANVKASFGLQEASSTVESGEVQEKDS
ncbi:hypothetical protein ScPMuIL_014443 [Solemya velum]